MSVERSTHNTQLSTFNLHQARVVEGWQLAVNTYLAITNLYGAVESDATDASPHPSPASGGMAVARARLGCGGLRPVQISTRHGVAHRSTAFRRTQPCLPLLARRGEGAAANAGAGEERGRAWTRPVVLPFIGQGLVQCLCPVTQKKTEYRMGKIKNCET